jgi:hypothetical protein
MCVYGERNVRPKQMVLSAARATIGNEQIELLTDNKTVRLPGTAPGWSSPLQRWRSGAKRRTRMNCDGDSVAGGHAGDPKSQLMSVMIRHWGSVRFTEPSSELRSDFRP